MIFEMQVGTGKKKKILLLLQYLWCLQWPSTETEIGLGRLDQSTSYPRTSFSCKIEKRLLVRGEKSSKSQNNFLYFQLTWMNVNIHTPEDLENRRRPAGTSATARADGDAEPSVQGTLERAGQECQLMCESSF